MKKIITILALCLTVVATKAQMPNLFPNFTQKADGILPLKYLAVPTDTIFGKWGLATKGSVLYIGNGTKWSKVVPPPTLQNTFVGVGNSSNQLSGSSNFAFIPDSSILKIGIEAGAEMSGAEEVIAIGNYSGKKNKSYTFMGIGSNTGELNIGEVFNGIGSYTGYNNKGNFFNGVGATTGFNNIGNHFNGMGQNAGYNNKGNNFNGFGNGTGFNNLGINFNGLGEGAGFNNSGINFNGFGKYVGRSNAGINFNGFGDSAGVDNTFNNVTLFGPKAKASAAKQLVFNNSNFNSRFDFNLIVDSNVLYRMPNKNGTIAMISDIIGALAGDTIYQEIIFKDHWPLATNKRFVNNRFNLTFDSASSVIFTDSTSYPNSKRSGYTVKLQNGIAIDADDSTGNVHISSDPLFGVNFGYNNASGTIQNKVTIDKFGTKIFSIDSLSKGLFANKDFSPNLDSFSYPQKIYVDKIKPYKVYTALLTQTGTNAPVATVLENTIGNIVWTRLGIGSYRATLAGAFAENKTFLPSPQNNNASGVGRLSSYKDSGQQNVIVFFFSGQFDNIAQDEIGLANIEIRVYN